MGGIATLLLADGRTPLGGYAHSGGLEAAVAAGLGPAGMPAFLRARLATVARTEAAAAVLAAGARDAAALLDLEDQLAARTPSAPARAAARALGLALLRTGRRLWPGDTLLEAYAAAARSAARPVALGVVGRAAGMAALELARLSLYEDAATVAAAAPKLLAVDAVDAAAWVAGVAPEIEAHAQDAVAQGVLGVLPAHATPLLDLQAERHHRDTRRLFAS